MPPRRRDCVEDVHDRENLRYLEQRMEQKDQRMDRMMEQLTQQIAALIENQNRKNPNTNPNPGQEEYGEESEGEIYSVEYDSYSEGDANIFIEEGPSDNAFFLYDEDDKEVDAVWETIDKRMDSQRKDRREARLKQEIEKYHASNQQMRARMSNVSIEPIIATEYFESEFFPIISSGAWANIDFRSSMEDVYVCVDNFISRLLGRIRGRILSIHGRMM
ncbi:hypothetical protein CRG98_043256 [Punica granatum]|uniref:PRP1 splicing factor N-terminal domain-containing protein n=1 Tax=Punica granatum TaxID=22663 RepID=A0A2I0HXD2_PUNGR|nr:hypothetical protein CRG98_043256 [Punica granatum]